MPTTAERHALAFVAAVALLGGTVRAWQDYHERLASTAAGTSGDSVHAAGESVGDQLKAVDGARGSRKGKRGTKPARTPVVIDADVASSVDLEKLPRVGPALADRIVANRDSFGAFGSMEELGLVRGIGESLQNLLKPFVTFSGSPSGLRLQAREDARLLAAESRKSRKKSVVRGERRRTDKTW